MPRTLPKTVKIYDLERDLFQKVINQVNATGEAQIGTLRWIERWLMPRIKRRAGGWTDYPPKARFTPQPEPDEPAVTVFVTSGETATYEEIMASIAKRAEELIGTPEGMAKSLELEPSEKD